MVKVEEVKVSMDGDEVAVLVAGSSGKGWLFLHPSNANEDCLARAIDEWRDKVDRQDVVDAAKAMQVFVGKEF